MSNGSILFKNCNVNFVGANKYLETVFKDGTKVPAVPHDTDDYRKTAEDNGYGDNLWALCCEHEAFHTFLCEKAGLPHSPTLWAVAHSSAYEESRVNSYYEEESLVLAFQRFLNTNMWSEELSKFELATGVKVADIKQEALQIRATLL